MDLIQDSRFFSGKYSSTYDIWILCCCNLFFVLWTVTDSGFAKLSVCTDQVIVAFYRQTVTSSITSLNLLMTTKKGKCIFDVKMLSFPKFVVLV